MPIIVLPEIRSLLTETFIVTTDLGQFSQRLNFPFLHGLYLGVNAISDAFLLVDSPNCGFYKTEHVFGAHDWLSTLLDVSGRHRVLNTDINVDDVISGHDQTFRAALQPVAESGLAGVVFVSSMPMASITGVDYEGLIGEVAASVDVPFVLIPGRSLDKDWLEGYADFLLRTAQTIGSPDTEPCPNSVAVVGYFMDRNEEDHQGNLRELRRLVEALDLDLVSVWLEGGPYDRLQDVFKASHIVSLPHGRQAAQTLADRSGANLIEVDIPLGPDATERFLRALGDAADRSERAQTVIDDNMSTLASVWEWLIPKRLQHRKVRIVGDPYLMPGLAELTSLLGMEVVELVAMASPKDGFEPGSRWAEYLRIPITWEPREGDHTQSSNQGPVDLTISPNNGRTASHYSGGGERFMEFGFPSRGYHCTFDSPFLGYRGAAAFVDRMSNILGDRGVFQ